MHTEAWLMTTSSEVSTLVYMDVHTTQIPIVMISGIIIF